MAGVMRRPFPDLPGLSAFPELNLRLYVEYDGKPGVWFLSLDATNPIAVWAARRLFHLPYFRARISVVELAERVEYRSLRVGEPRAPAFEADYRPTGPVYEAQRGSLEHWLTERYCLYSQAPSGALYRAEVHHQPWPLQPAEATILRNDLSAAHGIELRGPPLHLHYSRRLDVALWNPTAILS
jgi:uncharacterized protein YqjF (DUF2071 family)